MIGFFLTIIFVLLSTHLFVLYSAFYFFDINKKNIRNKCITITIPLAISSILSAILVKNIGNFATEVFYIFSTVWLAMFINFLLGTFCCWPIIFILHNSFKKKITVFIILFSMIYTSWGIWNGFHPQIKRIDVKIKGLPKIWNGKTIVQISDVHLGVVNRVGFLKKVIKQINSINPELVLITGDLFDGMAGDLKPFIAPLNTIISKKGVYFVHGNHEIYRGLSEVLSMLKNSKLKILDYSYENIDGIQIVGIGFPEFGKTKDDFSKIMALKGYSIDKPTILLYHTPTNINSFTGKKISTRNTSYWNPDINMSTAKKQGINLQLSGHTHKGQIFPFGFLTNYLYKGQDYGLFTDQDFNLYTTSGTGTWGPPMRTWNTPEIVAITLLEGKNDTL